VILEKTRLDISQITAGMRLAEPIGSAGGVTLMPAGIRLTPMFIARIKKWNIGTLEVFVDNMPADALEEQPAASTRRKTGVRERGDDGSVSEAREQFARAVAAEMAKVFNNVRENQLMMRLRSIALKRIVAKGANSPIAVLRRGPMDELPLPIGEDA
jgi:hypothetical protein